MAYVPSDIEKSVFKWVSASVDAGTTVIYANQTRNKVPDRPFVTIEISNDDVLGSPDIEEFDDSDPEDEVSYKITTEHDGMLVLNTYGQTAYDVMRDIIVRQERHDILLVMQANSLAIRDDGPIRRVFEEMDTEVVPRAICEFQFGYRHVEEFTVPVLDRVVGTGQEGLDGLIVDETL